MVPVKCNLKVEVFYDVFGYAMLKWGLQLLSKFFLDSDFCHNYLYTPVGFR